MNIELVSFYSDVDNSTYYSDHAKRLIFECESLGIPFDIKEKQSEGSYQKNCLSKPRFLLETLMTKKKPFVWMDVDSYLLKQPLVFEELTHSYDLAFVTSNGDLSGLKASPIMINITPKTIYFLETWIQSTERVVENNRKHFDHEPLFMIVNMLQEQMNMAFLGKEYCAWPKEQNEKAVVMMGLSDVESKKENLRAMGMSEDKIEWQSVGKL